MSDDGVFRALVTGEQHTLLSMNQRTAFYANWLDSKQKDGRETYIVTVMANERSQFLGTARETGVTVEELDYVDDAETYTLLVGAPGTGWAN